MVRQNRKRLPLSETQWRTVLHGFKAVAKVRQVFETAFEGDRGDGFVGGREQPDGMI